MQAHVLHTKCMHLRMRTRAGTCTLTLTRTRPCTRTRTRTRTCTCTRTAVLWGRLHGLDRSCNTNLDETKITQPHYQQVPTCNGIVFTQDHLG